jgi:cytochrome c556
MSLSPSGFAGALDCTIVPMFLRASSMHRVRIASAVVFAIAVGGVTHAADPAPTPGPGWTGVTKPADVITARQEIMEHAEILMEPIDTITIKEVTHPDRLRSNAEAIEAMLGALPHLFPPTTNLYDPKVQEPATLALPAIWKDFPTFYKLAMAASSAAEAMAETHGKDQLRQASLRLRASCDACHALYLRPYEPPKFQESDYQFDFDSALRKQ